MRILHAGLEWRYWGRLAPDCLDRPERGQIAGGETAMLRAAFETAARGHEVVVVTWCRPGTHRGVRFHDNDDFYDLVLDGGACDVGLESTVLDLTCAVPRLLRPGGVGAEAIRRVVGELEEPLMWVTFSSNRDYGLRLRQGSMARAQLWMAAFRPGTAGDPSAPAFWLPFQDVNESNHIAQWVETVRRTDCTMDRNCAAGESCIRGTCVGAPP